MRVGVRDVAPRLPRPVWLLHAGMALHTTGGGFVAPFLVIYLHDVRGLAVETAGLAVGVHFAVAMVSGLVAGPIVDHVGPRAVTAAALAVLTAGVAALPLAYDAGTAFTLLAAAGVGRGAFWPAYSALLAALTPPERMHASYAVQRVTGNLGLGLGGLGGGLIAATSDSRTFVALFLVNAGASLAFAAAVLFLPHVPPEKASALEAAGGYRDVLRDRAFIATVALGGVFTAAGVAQLNSMLPVFAKSEGVSETGIGLIFFFNTLAIVVAQFPVAVVVEGRRRMPVLALMGIVWAACWAATLAAGLWLPAAVATAALVVVGVAFALGECLDGVTYGPLVADLAPAGVRGRYMAVWLVSSQLGLAVGPAVGGFLLARSPIVLWPTAAAVCLAAGLTALALESRIPGRARRTPAREPRAAAAGA